MIGFSKNNFSKVVPCTVELLNSAIDSAEVMNVCGQIARKLDAVKAGQATRTEFDEYKTAMKKQLPVLTLTPSLRMVNARMPKPSPLDSRCTISITLRIPAVTITR